jgi:(E)-4-hydroxy-3-methylbut-2-enyl-diphosphate synthase
MKWKTREVMVGHVGVGGDNPVRIQSMTTSDTRDVEATVNQIIRLADAGCEIARVTVQGMKEADACEGIKNGLLKRGYTIPLVADIHFYPPAAMRVVDFVDKVRINPGNFVDKRATFKILQYDDASYELELQRIEEKFAPLVEKCIALKRSMRIGTNHGSLSDRIMNRYGDTPLGMVESAFEFTRVCRKMGYHEIIFSMKSSNPVVMIEAYRLLVREMQKVGWDYPLHLGVTEAGEGEDGRIKSSVGTGTLLLDGIGDTIRVSLTEDPWEEIDPCRRLIASTRKREEVVAVPQRTRVPSSPPLHPDGSVLLWKSSLAKADVYLDAFPVYRLADWEPGAEGALFVDREDLWEKCLEGRPSFILYGPSAFSIQKARRFFAFLEEKGIRIPVILSPSYECSAEDFVIQASAECGALLTDQLGEGIALRANLPPEQLSSFSFNLLQACRMRSSKTEFISCPGCGRTLFDLQEVARKIRERTAHLPGVKIAIMGCIVNGPGEMADADFGYVGSKPKRVDLYYGKTCVKRDIPHEEAVDELVLLIKEHNRWVEPIFVESYL